MAYGDADPDDDDDEDDDDDNEEAIGSLSNDDGDVNENGKKAISLDWQNNNCARESRFFVHFFSVTARLQRENT